MTNGLIHVFNETGHRASYRDFLSKCLNLTPATGKIDATMAWRLIGAEQLLFATVSGRTAFKAILIATFRAVLGKRTTAISMSMSWFRDPARPVRSTVTKLLYRFLEAIRQFRVLVIIPYELMPELSRTTSDWILDLCFWDLPDQVKNNNFPQTALSKHVSQTAAGRAVVVFLGRATARKGYSDLAGLARSINKDALIVSAGIVSDECCADADALRALGMIVEDRRISEEELMSLYGVADYVWCRYDATSSQMSSGVFGRAVQLGRPAVVPAGSYLDRLARLLAHPVVHDLGSECLGPLARSPHSSTLSCVSSKPGEHRLALMARESIEKLVSSL